MEKDNNYINIIISTLAFIISIICLINELLGSRESMIFWVIILILSVFIIFINLYEIRKK